VDLPPELPPELIPPPAPTIVHSPPRPIDQWLVSIDETVLDLPEIPVMTLGRLRLLAAEIGFEPAMVMLARTAAHVMAIGGRGDQLQLAEWFYGPGPVLERMRELARSTENVRLFAEQHIYTLMRVLVDHARDELAGGDIPIQQIALIRRALLGCSSVVSQATEATHEFADDAEGWIAYSIQACAYQVHQVAMPELARAQKLLALASSEEVRDLADFTDVHDWFTNELGLSADEQLTLGLGLSALTHAWDTEGDAVGRDIHIGPDLVDDLLVKAGMLNRREEVLAMISATRPEFAAAFAQAGGGEPGVVWELRPWKTKPFLRTQAGGLILLSPRFLQSWLSEGFSHRALTHAQSKDPKTSARLTRFSGQLYERYGLQLMTGVHADASNAIVHGERDYGRGSSGKTSDVAIEHPDALVLMELTNSRPKATFLVSGDPADARAELDRVLIGKCDQLGKCIRRVLDGDAPFPASRRSLLTIWPVVVSGGLPIQSPIFWDYLTPRLHEAFSDPRVAPITLLDLEEFEIVAGLIEAGNPLPEILARKTLAGYRHMDFKQWVWNDPRAPRPDKPATMVQEAFEAAHTRMMRIVDFTKGIQAA
jgi:hypothetical protein